jgi:hypothetical protein
LSVRRLPGASGALACAALFAVAVAACGQVRPPSLAPGGAGHRASRARGELRLISGNGMPVASLRPAARDRAIALAESTLARAEVPPGSHLVARLPGGLAVAALRALYDDAAPEPGDLVFCTASGRPLDAAHVRRFFRAVCTAAGIGPGWTPRELRHTFVSLMSDSDVAVRGDRPARRPRQQQGHRNRLPPPASPGHHHRSRENGRTSREGCLMPRQVRMIWTDSWVPGVALVRRPALRTVMCTR